MLQKLHVEVKNYDIEISDQKFEELMESLNNFTKCQKRLFVVSKKVYGLYKDVLNLKREEVLVLADGEKEKNFKNYIKILEKASEIGLTRSDVIIALGGGVIGDIAGFAASTYMRGIDYIQVPTTLLAMVDSSVGGKTAIDMKGAKNLIGSFYQPKKVFININFLKTLDERQYKSGLGEVLKYGFIEKSCGFEKDLYLFEYLTLCCEKFFEYDSVTLIRMIDYCLKLKIAVVNQDEKESSLRKILNLGHTFGHALETITNFKKYTHGEAVAQGLFLAFDMAFKTEMINYSYYRLSIDLIEKYGFVRDESIDDYQPKVLVELMKKDKKALAEKIVFILPCAKKEVKEVKLYPKEVYGLITE